MKLTRLLVVTSVAAANFGCLWGGFLLLRLLVSVSPFGVGAAGLVAVGVTLGITREPVAPTSEGARSMSP
ncbi:MAG: hypothetical protein NTV23_03550 [Propionibacteriales bacterium]|nr:hypothetical protein [Propionibacteriales bacterium]